jgi:hypothetical protein
MRGGLEQDHFEPAQTPNLPAKIDNIVDPDLLEEIERPDGGGNVLSHRFPLRRILG